MQQHYWEIRSFLSVLFKKPRKSNRFWLNCPIFIKIQNSHLKDKKNLQKLMKILWQAIKYSQREITYPLEIPQICSKAHKKYSKAQNP